MSEIKKLDICYASSNEFAIHTGISLLSLLDNNVGNIGNVYILDYGILDDNKERLSEICQKYNVSCNFIPSKDILVEIGQKTGIKNFRDSYATYSRAFIDKLLPETVDKVLYVDSDTVVNGSIDELCDYDMTGKVVAGCVNALLYDQKKGGHPELNVLTGNKKYIQCGIILYSLKNWRKENCHKMIMETCPKLETLHFADQTLINNSISDKLFGFFSQKYNLTTHIYNRKISLRKLTAGGWYTQTEAEDSLDNTVIVHFAGMPIGRPWYTHCASRYKDWYLKYKAISPWKDVPLINRREYENIKGVRKVLKDNLMLLSMQTNSPFWSKQFGRISRYV